MATSDSDSDLNSQELDLRTAEAQPQNTRRSTNWAVSVYRRWAARRQQYQYVQADLLEYGDDLASLNRSLYKFYSEVHTTENEAFTPSSLQVRRYYDCVVTGIMCFCLLVFHKQVLKVKQKSRKAGAYLPT